ncbi:hypothetical protein ACJX0J_016439, partial [Zea mays]
MKKVTSGYNYMHDFWVVVIIDASVKLLQLMHNFLFNYYHLIFDERRTCKTKVINGSMSDAWVKAVTEARDGVEPQFIDTHYAEEVGDQQQQQQQVQHLSQQFWLQYSMGKHLHNV